MKFIGNLIWVIFGGLEMAIVYLFAGIACLVSIIGIPFGFQLLKIGMLCLWPFGHSVEDSTNGSGCISLIFNILWIVIFGVWTSIAHVLLGIIFCITIFGIPFGKQHFKLALIALTPFGKVIR